MMSNLQFPPDKPPLILALDTSAPRASFALARGAEVVASSESDTSIPHSKVFFDLLSKLLRAAGLSLADIGAFAAATGPGSFTGLRVGLSAIKGLSHALGKPAIGVNSIDAAALTVRIVGKILVVIDAGREEAYVGLREIRADGTIRPLGTDTVGPFVIESFDAETEGEPLAVLRLGARPEPIGNFPANWQTVTPAMTSAEAIAIRAAGLLQNQTRFGLHPHYVRPSDAEIKTKP